MTRLVYHIGLVIFILSILSILGIHGCTVNIRDEYGIPVQSARLTVSFREINFRLCGAVNTSIEGNLNRRHKHD